MEKQCPICDVLFVPKQYNSMYCSELCGKKAEYSRHKEQYIERSKKWYQDNIDNVRIKRKEYYRKNPEHWKAKSKEWRLANPLKKKCHNEIYKDKIRHGNKKSELIQEYGLRCSECGKEGDTYEIVAHHVTFNNKDHSEQVLLCRACHCRLHHSEDKKPLTKEQIIMAITEGGSMVKAEKILGVSKETLYRKRKQFNLV